jgi:archaellum component FlaC
MSDLNSKHILAAALALVESRLKEALDDIKESSTSREDMSRIAESVVGKKFDALPDFGTLIEGLENSLNSKLVESAIVNKSYADGVAGYLEKNISGHNHEGVYAGLSDFNLHNHDKAYPSKEEFSTHHHDAHYAPLADHNEFKAKTLENFKGLSTAVSNELVGVSDKIAGVKKDHDAALQAHADQAAKNHETALQQAIVGDDVVKNELHGKIDAATEKTSKQLSVITNQLNLHKANVKDSGTKVSKTLTDIKKEISGKADVGHEHDYAPADHSHGEYLTEAHMRAMNDHLSKIDATHATAIEELRSGLSGKADDSAAVKVADLGGIKSDMIESVKKSIPMPKDGVGWEFKQHATRKGTIMYKREDQKTWNQMVLFNDKILDEMMNAINNSYRQPQSFIGGAGPAYQDPREIISQGSLNDLMDVDTKTLRPTSNDIFMYDALTDQWVPRTMQDLAALIIPILENDMQKQYNKLVDQIDPLTMYVGESLPGTATTAASWRIKKITETSTGDISVLWAQASADFVHVWDDRLTYTYSI